MTRPATLAGSSARHRYGSTVEGWPYDLTTRGVFANLEVIQSATPRRHAEFLAAVGRDADDPEDQLATIEDQLTWMRDAGLTNVDCLWRWRGLAVLAGEAPYPRRF